MAKKKKKKGYKSWGQLTPEERARRVEKIRQTKLRNKMKREQKEKEKTAETQNLVSGYQELPINERDLIRDYSYLSRLQVSDSTRDWIEHRMHELRQRANKYEKMLYCVLKEKGVEFIHQAPFILDGKIYFADFYIPALRTLIELDGVSHDNAYRIKSDGIRDEAFSSYRMRTFRIENKVLLNKEKLEEVLTVILFNRKSENTQIKKVTN